MGVVSGCSLPPGSSGTFQLRSRVNGSTSVTVKSRTGVGAVYVCVCVCGGGGGGVYTYMIHYPGSPPVLLYGYHCTTASRDFYSTAMYIHHQHRTYWWGGRQGGQRGQCHPLTGEAWHNTVELLLTDSLRSRPPPCSRQAKWH